MVDTYLVTCVGVVWHSGVGGGGHSTVMLTLGAAELSYASKLETVELTSFDGKCNIFHYFLTIVSTGINLEPYWITVSCPNNA